MKKATSQARQAIRHRCGNRALRWKPIADIVPVVAELPSWKRRKAQPLLLDGVSITRMILEERGVGW
ncbi:MAG: hypothetical protein IPP85_01730 [Propionivibrio sp.]|nr:hypothetical protein [Propionivibrio sp.]